MMVVIKIGSFRTQSTALLIIFGGLWMVILFSIEVKVCIKHTINKYYRLSFCERLGVSLLHNSLRATSNLVLLFKNTYAFLFYPYPGSSCFIQRAIFASFHDLETKRNCGKVHAR